MNFTTPSWNVLTPNINKWKTHFLNMARNKLCDRGKRLIVRRETVEEPVIKIVSPAQQAVEVAESELEEANEEKLKQQSDPRYMIKGKGKRSSAHSSTSHPSKKRKKAERKVQSRRRTVQTRKTK